MVHEDNGFPNAQTRLPYFLVIRCTTNFLILIVSKLETGEFDKTRGRVSYQEKLGIALLYNLVNTTNTIVHFTPWLSSICVTESEMSLVKLGFSDIISKLKFSFCQNTLNLVGLQLNFCLIGGATEKYFKTAKYCA